MCRFIRFMRNKDHRSSARNAHAQRKQSASSADNSSNQVMMADFGSSEEVAVIGNTDLTSTESENNIINTVVLFVFLYKKHAWGLKS